MSLKSVRKKTGFSQSRLAQHLGCNQSLVHFWESGEQPTNAEYRQDMVVNPQVASMLIFKSTKYQLRQLLKQWGFLPKDNIPATAAEVMCGNDFVVCLTFLQLPGIGVRYRQSGFSVPLSWAIFNKSENLLTESRDDREGKRILFQKSSFTYCQERG